MSNSFISKIDNKLVIVTIVDPPEGFEEPCRAEGKLMMTKDDFFVRLSGIRSSKKNLEFFLKKRLNIPKDPETEELPEEQPKPPVEEPKVKKKTTLKKKLSTLRKTGTYDSYD